MNNRNIYRNAIAAEYRPHRPGTLLRFFVTRTVQTILRGLGLRQKGKLPASFHNRFQLDGQPLINHAVWLGHATILCNMDDLWFITDPVFSHRASPFKHMGPPRDYPPACGINDLPKLSAVLISHNHYDHLDEDSVMAIHEKDAPKFFVPEGLSGWFLKRGITNVTEVAWWQTGSIGPLTVNAVPALHFAARGLFDRNQTHWCGWVVTGSRRFFFAGDTGYSRVFKEIGDRLGPMDLAVIPIGAYDPQWMMKGYHIGPEEGLDVFADVKGRKMLPVHYGGFDLTYEPCNEPPERLEAEANERGLSPDIVGPVPMGIPIPF